MPALLSSSTDLAPAAHAPADLEGWLRYFRLVEIPVLSRTADALEDLRANEDAVDARMLGEVIAADPLMTLKLLAFIAGRRNSRQTTDVETATEALVLLGITPFFRAFGPQPTVEEHLQGQPEALAGLRAVMRRAHRAGRFALGFAIHRFDHDAPVISEAAMLHGFAEMLLWLHAPALALDIAQRQQAEPTLRSLGLQRQVLNATLPDIQHALMIGWRLPELLIRITDERHQEASQVRNVLLAVRLARHTSAGWDNPAVADDVRDIAQLINMSPQATSDLLRDIDD